MHSVKVFFFFNIFSFDVELGKNADQRMRYPQISIGPFSCVAHQLCRGSQSKRITEKLLTSNYNMCFFL